MSYFTPGEDLSSSRTHNESLPTGESKATSLSSRLNLHNSKPLSSSQPCAEDTFYLNNNQYSLPHSHNSGLQQHQLDNVSEYLRTPVMVSPFPRSNPIAIIRAPGDGNREEVESDIDDDDSEIDVEGDAIKLQRKYGNKIIQTYIQESTIVQSSDAITLNKSSALNAPYLGSLSKSSNQVLSLPPISLAGDSTYLGEPPESIVSYGSLRDSHRQGRFLDGPSSYREPMSGKIRQLDHRLRYHGRQPELNIGERLQQSRKLKELRRKKEHKEEKGERDKETTDEEEKQDKKEAKSSLSAIMRDASQNINIADVEVDDFRESNLSFSNEHLLNPIQREKITSPHSHGKRYSLNESPRNMLSTSLTAFELLKSSNTGTSHDGKITNTSYSVTCTHETSHMMHFRSSSGFQPLSRSMSDPSPRAQNFSLSEIPTSSCSTAIQTAGLAAQMENALADFGQRGNNRKSIKGMEHTNNKTLIDDVQFRCQKNAATSFTSVMLNGVGHQSPHPDHDPNVDGAFGDLDM